MNASTNSTARPRAERLVPVALFAIVLLVAVLTVTPWPVGAFQDDAIYTVLAKALATGEGYRMINLPGSPHATHYPPGYPAFLAVLWRLWPEFPDNIVVFKFANCFLLALAALGTYAFARRRLALEPLPAAGVALVGTLSIVVLLITGVILSEPMFMALLLPTLLMTERVADEGGVKRAALAGLLLGALALVRTLGVVAIPAAWLVLLVRRRFRELVPLVLVPVLVLVPWQLWVSAYTNEIPEVLWGKYGAYGPWLAKGYAEGGLEFARAVAVRNVQDVDGMFSYMFMPVQAVPPRAVAFVTLIAVLAFGAWKATRRMPVTTVFVAAYVTIIMLWPFEPNRFLLALWPILVMLVVATIRTVWNWRPSAFAPRVVRLVVAALVAMILGGFATYNGMGYTRSWWASVQRDVGRRAKPIVEWVARRTNPQEVLATDDDLIVYLYTGRRAVPTSTFLPRERVKPLTPDEDVAALRAILAAYRPAYFVTTSRQGIQTANALAGATPPLLRGVATIPNALIYQSVTR